MTCESTNIIFYFIYIINYDEVKKCFYCNKIINPVSVIENIWKYIHILYIAIIQVFLIVLIKMF